jgi:RNA polymerase sigma-70 factor (ECF subfamily)
LIRLHAQAILAYVTRRVGPHEAEDLAAETFCTAFRRRADYVPVQSSALPWLYGIATNLLRGHSRAEGRRIHALHRMAAASCQTVLDNDSARAAEARDHLQEVASAFANLPAEARDVLVLVGVEGLSYEEASAALGVPVGTVRSRLSRARQQLRSSMGATRPW